MVAFACPPPARTGQARVRAEGAVMITWTLLHVLSMFIAFGLTVGVGVAATAISNSRDVRAIRAATKVAPALQTVGAVWLAAGLIFGIATAASAGFNFQSMWLVVGLVCVLLLLAIGIGIHRSWLLRLAKAAAASPDDHASAEVNSIIDEKLAQAAGPISGLIWLAAIAVMILKP